MYTPTKWETFKSIVRAFFCHHKHTEIRSVKAYSDGENQKIIGKFKYCFDCKNNISGWL